jgi:hypothetical protein
MRLIAAERELDPLLHCSKGPHPNPLPAVLGLSLGTERKARVQSVVGIGQCVTDYLGWHRLGAGVAESRRFKLNQQEEEDSHVRVE